MNNRLASMIATVRHALMRSELECTAPGNRFCLNLLSLLRENGIIAGFHLNLEPKHKKTIWKGYPRITIQFKYYELGIPLIKDIKYYKRTRTNFYMFKTNMKNFNFLGTDRLFVITTPKGLTITTLTDMNINDYHKKRRSGILVISLVV